ncbi:TPA: helix-turn-helix domain-containing protein [Elizabethkingia meningoseptica]|uniref:helix-turn-helix domain-containing protein n=1 Tax=Elizabethkingia meningoseptica TaxID=238 RepID=UPI0015910016|nr:helix-turn-helix domain-containing protein [Elizabethkingia meningoseptica]
MMKYIILLILLLFNNLVNAQNHKIDSLAKFTYRELKSKFYDYNDRNKILQSEQIAKYYLKKAKKENNTLEIAEGYNLIHFNKDFSIAIKYIDSLAVITKDVKGNLYPARTYLIKGNLYYKYDNLKAALDNYILGLKYAKEQKDEKQTAYANMNIAYINSYIGKNIEASKIFRHYLYNKSNIMDDYQYNQMRVALISCYLDINKLDSANILIREGQEFAIRNKNNYDISLYTFLSGIYDLRQKRYEASITKLSEAYPQLMKINETNANYALYNLGKAYDGIKDEERAVQYFVKVDSNVQKTDNLFPELKEVYTYIINYYKEKNDKEKQLLYIERFLRVNNKLDEQFKYLSNELPKKYEIPNLVQEKEEIIHTLKRRKIILNISISILLLILLLLSYLYYRSRKTEKEHRRIAQDLIHSVERKNSKKITIEINPVEQKLDIENEIESKSNKVIPEDVTKSILHELDVFESNELFLKKGITLNNLAKQIKTNSSYLSDTINTYKEKNFATYLNDLRIDYALDRLVKDKKFRAYKLAVIANELGYNNEQAFASAFKRKTGTTLSIYIKEIEKTGTL